MKQFSLEFFESKAHYPVVTDDRLSLADDYHVSVRDGVPRFSPDTTYSDGNFGLLRQKHAALQIDSQNGTTERFKLILERTGWSPEYFRNKVILECGCGAGPDTEILVKLGAKVIAADLTVDAANRNLGNHPNVQFIQADITKLPLKKHSFDIVFCHRVLQHTPNPEQTLDHILQFVKEGGGVFVHSYARTWFQMLRWKYALRPITRRLDSELLYRLIKLYAKPAFYFTKWSGKTRIGSIFNWFFVPFLNYCHLPKYSGMSDEFFIEHGIHDTFDALSPRYDCPVSVKRMKEIANKHVSRAFEIQGAKTITLLRTIP